MMDLGKLQDEFIKKIGKAVTFAQVKTQKVNENSASLFIESKYDKPN
jgi:hypothetical protein